MKLSPHGMKIMKKLVKKLKTMTPPAIVAKVPDGDALDEQMIELIGLFVEFRCNGWLPPKDRLRFRELLRVMLQATGKGR